MTKVVYVTGCLGFIGSYVTRACLSKGWFVRGVDSETYASDISLLKEFNSFSNFYYEKKDINDLKQIHDCDYVINTAAETHVDNSITSSDIFIKSNINGVHKLLELIKIHKNYKMPTLIHFSTDEVYGDIEEGSFSENQLLKPSNPYAASKAAADQLILAWNRTYGVPYVIVRPTNNYGLGQYVEKLIPKAIKYLSLGRKIPLHNNGNPKRMWLHASDTAEGVIKIIESTQTNCIFNISGDTELKNIEVVGKIIKNIHGNDSDINSFINFSVFRNGQDVRYSINDSKLRSLGWNPKKVFDIELNNIIKNSLSTFKW